MTKIDQFLDKLFLDTVEKRISWHYLHMLLGIEDGKQYSNLKSILAEHMHSQIIHTESFFTTLPNSSCVLLLTRRSMSGLDGRIIEDYTLYLQTAELQDYIQVQTSRSQLIKLLTLVKNYVDDSELPRAIESSIDSYLSDSL